MSEGHYSIPASELNSDPATVQRKLFRSVARGDVIRFLTLPDFSNQQVGAEDDRDMRDIKRARQQLESLIEDRTVELQNLMSG